MPKTPGYEYRCDSNPLIFQGTYIGYQAEINGDFTDLDLANDSAVGWYQDQ